MRMQVKKLPALLFRYFEDTYICRRHGRRRENPNFSISTRNQFDRIINDQPRINNNIEGLHRGFSSMFNHVHPNIFVFLKKIKDEQFLIQSRLARMELGKPFPMVARHNKQPLIRELSASFCNIGNWGQ
ncbi:hypothetical protein RF11_16073 [Thelohanellus kitauei]|uniref:Uncharacterized protein n=1 Tax=Thelohanellus kitauei TaxID=669202 RepID=A0A0C2IJV9_THEKT|nr:hypothetical protein RF11_16073 [Thelohanellus kitauei]